MMLKLFNDINMVHQKIKTEIKRNLKKYFSRFAFNRSRFALSNQAKSIIYMNILHCFKISKFCIWEPLRMKKFKVHILCDFLVYFTLQLTLNGHFLTIPMIQKLKLLIYTCMLETKSILSTLTWIFHRWSPVI